MASDRPDQNAPEHGHKPYGSPRLEIYGGIPYESPRLEVYGGIDQLTKMVGAIGAADGGGGGSNKTMMIINLGF